ncbi:MAG: class I SAM-dependent methyltransferase [Bacteroidales bacterium]
MKTTDNNPGYFWDVKYSGEEYLYGLQPNRFIAKQLSRLSPGQILLPAEGEGRNALFAARNGWKVTAYDLSRKGREKALALAEKAGVTIDYRIAGFIDFDPGTTLYDVVALSFVHMPGEMKSAVFGRFISFLKPGGRLIMEAFSKNQLSYSSGGPKDPDLLYSVEEVGWLTGSLIPELLREETVLLDEGPGHQGEGAVIRLVALKA